MAAARSSSSSQIDRAPRVTIRAPSRTPNTGAAGLTVPAPSPARALPASVMNFWASAEALPGWLWARVTGATTTSSAATASTTRTARAQARLRSWCIGELLELAGLADQFGGRGRGGDVGDRHRPVAGGAVDLLPVAAGPAQPDGGGAPALADRDRAVAAAQGAADTGHPDGHGGRPGVEALDPPADRGGPQQHLGILGPGGAD